MGQKELVLLTFGTIVTGLALVSAIEAFDYYKGSSAYSQMETRCYDLATRMVQRKMKPIELGGFGARRDWRGLSVFRDVTGIPENKQFYDVPSGTITFTSQNMSGHLLCYPSTHDRSEVIDYYITQGRDRGAIVRRSGNSWRGTNSWLQDRGLIDDEGSFVD